MKIRVIYIFSLTRVTLYAEFLPVRQRGKCVVLLDVLSLLKIITCRPIRIELF
jgi:hypothetical protein